MNTTWKLVLTSLIMLVAGALGYALSHWLVMFFELETPMSALIIVPLFVALGAVLPIRLWDIQWPDPLYAVFPGAAAFTILLMMQALADQSIFVLVDEATALWAVAMFTLFSTGTFLLPLFDPMIRDLGPDPHTVVIVIVGAVAIFGGFIVLGPTFVTADILLYASVVVVSAGIGVTIFRDSKDIIGETIGGIGAIMLFSALLLRGLMVV